MNDKKINNNPFIGRNDNQVFPGHDYSEKDLAFAVEVEKVKKTGEGDQDFVVLKELKIDKVVNRQDYINQFQDDVGILNVLKRVAKTGDESLINQRPVASGYMDLTNMPHDIISAAEKIDQANALYEKLPDDIKSKLTKDDLIKINNLDLYNAIENYVAQKKQVKEGD